jgi:hypothetical protein
MKTLKTGYEYLFCFFYNSVNKVKGNILVQFKALFMVLGLEILFISSFFCYGIDIFKFDVPQKPNTLFILMFIVPLVGLKLWFFERNENWKAYLLEFNALPEQRQKKWKLIMRAIVFFVIANFIFSFYLMSQIDWKQYR